MSATDVLSDANRRYLRNEDSAFPLGSERGLAETAIEVEHGYLVQWWGGWGYSRPDFHSYEWVPTLEAAKTLFGSRYHNSGRYMCILPPLAVQLDENGRTFVKESGSRWDLETPGVGENAIMDLFSLKEGRAYVVTVGKRGAVRMDRCEHLSGRVRD